MPALRRAGVLAATLAVVLLASACSPRHPGDGPTSSASQTAERSTAPGPDVIHTGSAPTGYEVTFHLAAPGATRVQVWGEWLFSTPGGSTGLTPAEWRMSAFPADELVSDMTRSPGSDVWSLTIPLPSGVFSYGFFVDCANDSGKGCDMVPDPDNPPWNAGENVGGSTETTSQVYVPSDPAFGTADFWWQAPGVRPAGAMASVTYPSPGHVDPQGENRLAIYTPPGYDPQRAQPYPTLYLSHGGGGNEIDWSTQGALPTILDNLIGSGQIQPMVAVMINIGGYPTGCPTDGWDSAVADDLVSDVVPFVEQQYNVATEPSSRAFAGLSCGGSLGHVLLLDHPAAFGYVGVFSPGGGRLLTSLTPEQATSLDTTGIFVGGGIQEPVSVGGRPGPRANAVHDVATLAAAGLAVTPSFVNGTHEWYVWRILLHDYLTRVAFWPPVDRVEG